MAHYNFRKDLKEAEVFEDKMQKYFELLGCTVERCKNGDYDMVVNNPEANTIFAYEIKNDLMASDTGNIAIEYESRGKPSGISKTKSDFYIIKYKGGLLMLETEKIKELIQNKTYFRKVVGGDYGSKTKMYLFKLNDLLIYNAVDILKN